MSSNPKIHENEVTPVEENLPAITPIQAPGTVSLGVIDAHTPQALVTGATEVANSLADVIKSRELFSRIGNKNYVHCEGWTTLATMMGVLPKEVSVERTEDGTYIAIVELVRIHDGMTLTRASAECGSDEPMWKNRANYARRSMAVTRATSKACRIAFSWVMVLAGYEATPNEEMPRGGNDGAPEPDRHNGDNSKQILAGDLEREMKSKYGDTDNPNKCKFCGNHHIIAGDRIVLANGLWGVEECFRMQKLDDEAREKAKENQTVGTTEGEGGEELPF